MMRKTRKILSRRASAKMFTRTAQRTHIRNLLKTFTKGGFHL